MNTQQQQSLPCPECGNQRYSARNQGIEMSCYPRGYDFYCTIVICGTCGYTAFYASDPRDTIATIEKRLAEARKREQIILQERLEEEAAARMKAQKKKGFLGF
jgi:hypothetical protein